jgi:hypothetical protein
MRNPRQIAVHHPLIRSGLELLAILFVWLVVVGSGTACFFAPRGSEAQPTYSDVIGFGCSLAIAGAVATSVAFALGGRTRWAGQVLLAIALATATATALAYLLLWVDPLPLRGHLAIAGVVAALIALALAGKKPFASAVPLAIALAAAAAIALAYVLFLVDAWPLRNQMDASSFQRLRDSTRLWGEQIGGFQWPLAAGVGVVVGVLAGLLIRLSRRRPRLATMLALTLLFACAASAVKESLFGLVVVWGKIIRWHIIPWGLIDDQISESGAVFGAIAGALIAAISSHFARRGMMDRGSDEETRPDVTGLPTSSCHLEHVG